MFPSARADRANIETSSAVMVITLTVPSPIAAPTAAIIGSTRHRQETPFLKSWA